LTIDCPRVKSKYNKIKNDIKPASTLKNIKPGKTAGDKILQTVLWLLFRNPLSTDTMRFTKKSNYKLSE